MKKTLILALLAGCLAHSAWATVQTREITYKEGKTELKGFLAYDDAVKGPRPGVLIVHSWMGVGDYEKGRAKQLAELGYSAFAADIYGAADTPKDQKEAGVSAGKYKGDRPLYRKRVQAGLDVLTKQAETDKTRLAAIGYCFGGTGALELARSGAKLKGAVVFHGGVDNPAPLDPKKINAKLLVLQGADDPWLPKKDMDALETELRAAKADYQITYYSGAVHAFTMPGAGNDNSSGAAYNASADKRSWLAMQNFFQEIFSK